MVDRTPHDGNATGVRTPKDPHDPNPAVDPSCAVMIGDQIAIPLTDDVSDPARQNVHILLNTARRLGIDLPHRFYFSAGQIFYQNKEVEELRLVGAALSNPWRDNDQIVRWKIQRWSTSTAPKLTTNAQGQLELDATDEGRAHFSALATLNEEKRPAITLCWDLNTHVPDNLFKKRQKRVQSKTLPVRSVMSPIPMPRAAVKGSASLSLVRGLGRMFAGYSKVPDLDLRGKTATQKAEQAFWKSIHAQLDEVCATRQPASSWRHRKIESDQFVIVLRGFQEPEAQILWRAMTKRLNKGEGGPGIEVAQPGFTKHNRLYRGQAVIETHIHLWPEESLKNADGWSIPPVRFRNEGSPGYMALLANHGQRPYFADGWLWVPRANEREGFRIGGLPTLLFPEGRAALEKVKQLELTDYEAQLNRVFYNPTLFQDKDARIIQDLKAAIRRTQNWLRELSVYEIGQDLILCVFETFYRQRDAWMNQRVRLPDGRMVETTPWRVIRLDPNDLRIRLDPRNQWGQNWRTRLFQKLETLTTFERQTRTKTGRKIDVGDRFLGRVIDGRQGVDEGTAPETDSGLGLTRALKRVGGVPTDAFFVEASIDFMERLVTWAVDDKGVVHWGIDAAKAAEIAALSQTPYEQSQAREIRQSIKEDIQTKPYFNHSPRLLTLGNLEGWPLTRKLFAYTLLQERTPSSKSKAGDSTHYKYEKKPKDDTNQNQIVTIYDREYIACNGKYGHGYKIKTWINKIGYRKHQRRQRTEAIISEFIDDLICLSNALDLQIQVKNEDKTTKEIIDWLSCPKSTPSKKNAIVLQAFLPVDLEIRLRNRLAEAGVEAVDEDEAPVFTKEPDSLLTPAKLQAARKKAGWNQSELAKRVGVSRQMLGYWENGNKPVPAKRLKKILELLNPFMF